jgi:hypothetical protein
VSRSGTAFSRSLEMQQDLASFLSDYHPDFPTPRRSRWIGWVLNFVDKVLGTTRALSKASFSGRRPENSSRGGKTDYARQRGGRGGGSDKGKGT